MKTITEQNKFIVRRFNKEFIEGGDMNVFEEIIAADFINHTAPPGAPKSREGVVYFFNHFLKPALGNLTVEILNQVAEDDTVTTYKIFHATHSGELMGAAATGKQVFIQVMDIIKLRDGKFVEHWNVADWQGLMMQINS
ncbi:MAG TPA: ester cyclase [Chitinophagaceae bacterium]|nr:ester cyclase [Chitinophagaceae bacterium]